jgi:hypothetical protein
MNALFILLPLLAVIAAVAYGVMRALGRIWLDHRVKLALLEKLQDKPEVLESFQEIQGILAGVSTGNVNPNRQDFTVTGIFLSLIGIACAIIGWSWGVGTLAVGIHVGGWVCIVLGMALASLGLLIRWLSRSPGERGRKNSE